MKVLFSLAVILAITVIPACATSHADQEVTEAPVALGPPEVPQFVDQCRSFIVEKTGEKSTSDRANFYCGCVAELGLHLSAGWERKLNVSEQETLISMCLADSYIVYPAVNIEPD